MKLFSFPEVAAPRADQAGEALRPVAFGPLRLLDSASLEELDALLQSAVSVGLLWSRRRPRELLGLCSQAASGRARIYLIGPPDLGNDLEERGWHRRNAARLLSRRGVSSAADLLLLNAGRDREAVLFLHQGDARWWIRLSPQQAEAAADGFAHLFWHHAAEEGRAGHAGFRFQRIGPPPFVIPAPLPDSPLWLTQEALPPLAGATVHEPGAASGPPPLVIGERDALVDCRAGEAGGWSARLQLDVVQAAALRADWSRR